MGMPAELRSGPESGLPAREPLQEEWPRSAPTRETRRNAVSGRHLRVRVVSPHLCAQSTTVRWRAAPAGGTPTGTSSLAAYQSVAEANDLYLTGRYRDAVERLQRSVKQDDTYAEAWALLGKSYELACSWPPATIRPRHTVAHGVGIVVCHRWRDVGQRDGGTMPSAVLSATGEPYLESLAPPVFQWHAQLRTRL